MNEQISAAVALEAMAEKLRQAHGILTDGPDDSDSAMAQGLIFEAIELARGAPSTPATTGDAFQGDNAKLIDCINALLALDAKGCLVPHGVGGHARTLLEASAARLAARPQAPATTGEGEVELARVCALERAALLCQEIGDAGTSEDCESAIRSEIYFGAKRARAALAAQPPSSGHPDDLAVDRFAAKMKCKLATARAKGRSGWDNPKECGCNFLAELLAEEIVAQPWDFVDIANFAMMLHLRGADPKTLTDAVHSLENPR